MLIQSLKKHILNFAAAAVVICSLSVIVKVTIYNRRFVLESLQVDSMFGGLSATTKKTRKSTKKTQRLCSMEEARHGQWLPVMLDKPPYIPTRSKCYSKKELEAATSWKEYRWYPFASSTPNMTTSSPNGNVTTTTATNTTAITVTTANVSTTTTTAEPCDYSQWDKDLFCRLAYNKTITFAGDSLTYEQFSSLAGLFGLQGLGAHNNLRFVMNGKVFDQNAGIIFDICDNNDDDDHGTTKIAYYRQRYLYDLERFIFESDPDILVLNRGAHVVSDIQLIQGFPKSTGLEQVVNILSEWQENCTIKNTKAYDDKESSSSSSSSSPACLAIWRTTAPGHPHCHTYHAPATSVEAMEQRINTRAHNPLWKFGHYRFKQQNELVLNFFQNATSSSSSFNSNSNSNNYSTSSPFRPLLLNQNNFDVLPGYDLGVLRPDGRISKDNDCLHSCDPGMPDAYNTMLLHLMRLHYDK